MARDLPAGGLAVGVVLFGYFLSQGGWQVFQDGSSCTAQLKDLDVAHVTFAPHDLTAFCRLDKLGLRAVGQRLSPTGAGSRTTIADADCDACRACVSLERSDDEEIATARVGHGKHTRSVCFP